MYAPVPETSPNSLRRLTPVREWHDTHWHRINIYSMSEYCIVDIPHSAAIQFRYASSGLWNKLPLSLRQPHSGTSSFISNSPIPLSITSSSFVSLLCSFITLYHFQARLKLTSVTNLPSPVVVLLFPDCLHRLLPGPFLLSYLVLFLFFIFLYFSF